MIKLICKRKSWTYNGIKPGQIVNVQEQNIENYLRNWFERIEKVEERKKEEEKKKTQQKKKETKKQKKKKEQEKRQKELDKKYKWDTKEDLDELTKELDQV